jgi:uncharacterized membrane protein SpoIIM required for sporulation
MRETQFIKENKTIWQKAEKIANEKILSGTDEIAEIYTKILNDLAYAQSFYPKSNTVPYLNKISQLLHQKIYIIKKNKFSSVIEFWKTDVPKSIYYSFTELKWALVIFIVSICIGIISAANDETFVRLILGDSYVNMTIENIKKNDPMAVYKSMHQVDMFFAITFNNILVSFNALVYGAIYILGTVYFMLMNGIMLGAFQYFFHTKGLLFDSMLVIWIHGTLEISAIVIAGGAGIRLGKSIFYPNRYLRKDSIAKGAKDAIRIIIGLCPVFIVAGFLESFVTRLTEMPDFIKMSIIILSFTYILWYFVFLPIKVIRRNT